jgi:hypothetical protein
MKQPPFFKSLLRDWIAMPGMLNEGLRTGFVAESPEQGWMPLQVLSAASVGLPPKAYANPGFARSYNQAIRGFRRRAAFSAFLARISQAELEARLETHALLMGALRRGPP